MSATIRIRAREPLAHELEERIRARVDEALAARPAPPALPVVRVRWRVRAVAGAHVIVELTPRHARRLAALVAGLEAAGAARIQLAWTAGPLPPPLEQAVFAVLEERRGRPSAVGLTDVLDPLGPPTCTVTRA